MPKQVKKPGDEELNSLSQLSDYTRRFSMVLKAASAPIVAPFVGLHLVVDLVLLMLSFCQRAV